MEEVAKSLNHTAIPAYVLTYGMSTHCLVGLGEG